MVDGYQKTSLSAITNKLGITKPALYYYFVSKKELFLECLKVFFDKLNYSASIYSGDSLTTKEQLKDILKHFANPQEQAFSDVEGFNQFYFVFDAMKHVPEVNDLYLESTSAMLIILQEVITQGITRGELKASIDVEALIFEIGVLIEGFALSHYMGFDQREVQMVDRVFELVWHGIEE